LKRTFFNKWIKIKYVNEDDNVPQEFISKLIKMYQNGQFPFNKLIKTYPLEEINQKVEDSEKGRSKSIEDWRV